MHTEFAAYNGIASPSTLAGAAGLLCGKSYQAAKDHPETVLPVVKLSAASGAVGALLGWGVSAYRNLPTHVYTLSLGANFAITSGVFFGMFYHRSMVLSARPTSLIFCRVVIVLKFSLFCSFQVFVMEL